MSTDLSAIAQEIELPEELMLNIMDVVLEGFSCPRCNRRTNFTPLSIIPHQVSRGLHYTCQNCHSTTNYSEILKHNKKDGTS